MTINIILGLIVLVILGVGLATGGTMATSSQLSPSSPSTSGGSTPVAATIGTTGHQSDGSLTGAPITNDPSTWPGSDNIWNICTAVALAEGFNQGTGTAPYDLNNPGDLSPGDEDGQATSGAPEVHDGSSIIHFQVCEGGFRALYAKFSNIVNGNSSVYPSSYTWTQVANIYAGNSSAWLNNVTSYLGVDPSSTPAQYVNGGTS